MSCSAHCYTLLLLQDTVRGSSLGMPCSLAFELPIPFLFLETLDEKSLSFFAKEGNRPTNQIIRENIPYFGTILSM